MPPFDAATYRQRRRQLVAQLDDGLILFLGHAPSPTNYAGNVHPFRQDSTFLYYWGWDAPDLAAVIDVESGQEVFFGHDPTVDEIVWTGPLPSLAERGAQVDVADCRERSALADVVQEAVAQGRTVHFVPAYRAATRHQLEGLLGIRAERINDYASEPLIRSIVAQRSTKTAAEIAEIEQAVDIAHTMHTQAMQMTRPGVTEQQVAGRIEGMALEVGGRLSFRPTVSVHGEVLHNVITDRPMAAGELLLVDAGAEAPSSYASDITRVTPVGGTFSTRQRDIYTAVLQAQQQAIAAIEPGVPFKAIHLQAARDLAASLKALGLMQGDVEEAVAAGAHALFFPHGLGHMMGLDVHDMEGLGEDYVGYDADTARSDQFGLNYLRLGRALEPGFVLTVEPGIYFIPALIDRWQAEARHAAFINYEQVATYRDFGGIRIEDDVLVTPEGHRVLGPPIPKTVDEVEAAAS